jgi:P27 family predicted phage terminase small subunit
MPAKKNVEEHRLAGTVPRHKDVTASHVEGSLPKPPKFLSPEAKKKFKAMVRQLAVRRAVTAGDGDLIAIYCSQDERWQQALTKIRDEGAVRIYQRLGVDGLAIDVEKENLHVKLAQNCERQMVTILSRLGLTPRDKDYVRPTSPVKPKHAPVDPNSAAGMTLEAAELRDAIAAEEKLAESTPPPEPEIDLNNAALNEAMEQVK